jgi:hypothetical protein
MNTNLFAIVRRIVTDQGEAILADPARLKGFISDYAKNESRGDRLAFGRCIEGGFYALFKNTRGDAERRRLKAALLPQLQAASGQSAAVCENALDLLEALLFPPGQTAPPSVSRPAPQSMLQPAPQYHDTMPQRQGVSKKTYIFGIAAGLGSLAGELVSDLFRLNSGSGPQSIAGLIANVAFWAALLGLGISAGLVIMQNLSTKKQMDPLQIVKTALIGIVVGSVAGALAQLIFGFTSNISVVVEIVSRVICWGILGFGLGWGASFYIPNYPTKRAMLAGLLGGVVGGAVFRALFVLPDPFARILGVMILGAAIGFSISYIEEALREAWLTIVWAQNETTTVSLGEKPLSFGSTREADVYLPQRRSEQNPPIRAVFLIENGAVVMDDRLTGRRQQLSHGSRVDLGRVSIVVNVKT